MLPKIYFTNFTPGKRARLNAEKSIQDIQQALPKNSQICCCVKKENKKVSGHFQVFIEDQVISWQYIGSSMKAFSDYVDNHVIHLLRNWQKDPEVFFEMASSRPCSQKQLKLCKEKCLTYYQLHKEAVPKVAS